MTRVQPKAMPNWCLQVKPDEPWTGRCVKEKIAADGKRHRCHKTEKHTELPVRFGVEAVPGGWLHLTCHRPRDEPPSLVGISSRRLRLERLASPSVVGASDGDQKRRTSVPRRGHGRVR
jgi:hypothetical protein